MNIKRSLCCLNQPIKLTLMHFAVFFFLEKRASQCIHFYHSLHHYFGTGFSGEQLMVDCVFLNHQNLCCLFRVFNDNVEVNFNHALTVKNSVDCQINEFNNITPVINVNTAIRNHRLNCIVLIVMVHKSISTAAVSLFQYIVLLYLQCKYLPNLCSVCWFYIVHS